ncbi:MAG: chloride channel protein [Candidatus Aenigmarchaeota archaeon]|nr:chloride channel protein [Candidatus Aenigmarchaeota archaeon]
MMQKAFIKKIHVKEYNILFFLSIAIGIVGGLGAVVFRWMIKFNKTLFFDIILPHISFYIGDYNIGVIVLPVLGGLIVGPLIYRFAREAKGHGVPEVIEAVHLKGGIMRPVVAVVKIIVSSVTIGSGGSAGREGPIAQIGAVFGSAVGRFFCKAKKNVRLMVSCGVAAGISATFNAPLGGAVFAMEIISIDVGLVSAVPILVSAVVGDVVMMAFMDSAPVFASTPYVFKSASEIPVFVVFGLVFGVLSAVWSRTFYKIERTFNGMNFPEQFKPVIGGLLIGLLGVFFLKYGIMGLGYEEINMALLGKLSIEVLIVLGAVKIIATSLTIGSGASGGIFAPSLYIGSMFGAACGLLAQHFMPGIITQPFAFALIGMGALFAGAFRAPMTALIMIPEMTSNYYLIIPMMIVSALSYYVASALTKNSMYLIKLENKGVKVARRESVLEDVMVEDVMTRDIFYVHPDTSVSDVLEMVMKKRHPGFPVVGRNKRFYGFVKVYDLRGVERNQRKDMKVKNIVKPDYPHVFPDDTVYHALNVMIRHNLGRIPVITEKKGKLHIAGIISKTDVIKAYEDLTQ